MMAKDGQLSVPPGFRFHPTDEELLYYYLRKKVSHEAIDLDVIREVDLNKFEPWDLKDKCRIGSDPQNEWYFFSHKDKKYPTGTRTNRATTAGFWKATGRDKAIHLSDSTRIGKRKTLIFYTGRAPHGQTTDWVMHEYRLDDDNSEVQEDGWVVCRVFKKNNPSRGFLPEVTDHHEYEHHFSHLKATSFSPHEPKMQQQQLALYNNNYDYSNLDASMHLPQLFSPESAACHVAHPFLSPLSNHLNTSIRGTCMDADCSPILLIRLTSSGTCTSIGSGGPPQPPETFSGDWSFLDKLLASHGHYINQAKGHNLSPPWAPPLRNSHSHIYLQNVLKFSN